MPDRMLVVSDLHLNIGLDTTTGNYDRRENFFADEAFARWLGYYRSRFRWSADTERTLVIAGDAFDFIRVDVFPKSTADYETWAAALERLGDPRAELIHVLGKWPLEERRDHADNVVSRREERFGLQTDDYKTVWKLIQIVAGHEPVFDALAAWIKAGARIVIMKGNHDVELHWPLVQKAIRIDLASRAGLDFDEVVELVRFEEQEFRSGNVQVEHGHRWEAMTAVHTKTPWLPQNPDQISLPLGSFVNRYLINGIERLDPFVDNVKPVGRAIRALLRKYPLEMIKLYVRGWAFLRRALRVKGLFNSIGGAAGILALVLIPCTALLLLIPMLAALLLPESLLATLPTWLASALAWLGAIPGWVVGASVLGVSLPALFPLVAPIFTEIGRVLGWTGKNHLLDGADRVSRHVFGDAPEDTSFIVMGHTHWQEVRRLDTNRLYMNSGTWVPIWPQERHDLAGRVFYSFLEFTRAGPDQPWTGKACQWDDATRRPRRSPLISSADERPLATPEVRAERDSARRGRARAALGLIFVLAAASGCSGAGRSLSRGAAEGLYERRDTLAATVGPVVESGAGGIGRTFRDSIRPELVGAIDELTRSVRDSLTEAIMDSVGARLDRLDDSVAVFIAGPANEALQELIVANLDATRASIDESLRLWVATLAASTEAQLAEALSVAAANAIGSAADSLAARMGSGRELRESIVSLGDSVVTQAIAAISRETGEGGLPWWIWAIIVAIALVVIAVVGRFILELHRRNRRQEDSLRIVGRAIKAENASQVAERVSAMAQEQGVEGWLHEFLAERRLLLEEDAATAGASVSSPGREPPDV